MAAAATREEGVQLFKEDVASVCWLADQYRKKCVGDTVYFSTHCSYTQRTSANYHVQCSFYAKPG